MEEEDEEEEREVGAKRRGETPLYLLLPLLLQPLSLQELPKRGEERQVSSSLRRCSKSGISFKCPTFSHKDEPLPPPKNGRRQLFLVVPLFSPPSSSGKRKLFLPPPLSLGRKGGTTFLSGGGGTEGRNSAANDQKKGEK